MKSAEIINPDFIPSDDNEQFIVESNSGSNA